MSTSSTAGSAEWTPPTTGATSRSRTRRPIRARTSAETLVSAPPVPSGGREECVQRGPERAQECRGSAGLQGPRGWPGCRGHRCGAVRGDRRAAGPRRLRVRRHDLVSDAQLRGEVRHGRGAGGEGLRAAVQGQPADHMAADASAPGPAGFEDCGADAGAGQLAGGQQAGDPAAHDHGGPAGVGPAPMPSTPGKSSESVQRRGSAPSGPFPAAPRGPGSGHGPEPQAPAAMTSRTCASRTSQGAESSAGSMLPCSGTVPPRRRLASSSGSR